jgi:pimeloyl-ACP methyl ester carboxylesterase
MPSFVTPAVKLNYVQIGDGDHLVMIHGLGANLSFWYFGAANVLAARHRLVMYDLRGHGRSSMPREGYDLPQMARDLLELLDFLAIERADIVGHSFGGRVALVFAAFYPQRVRNLIIADTHIRALQPPMRLAEWPHWPRWRAELQRSGLAELPSDDAFIDHDLLAKLSGQRNVPHADNAGGRLTLRASDMGGKALQRWRLLLAQTSAARDFEDERELTPATFATVRAPTLLLFGKFTYCLPSGEGLAQCLPDARLVVIPGAGHFFPLVRARFFARATERFLANAQAGGGRSAARRQMRRRFAAALA